VTTSNSVAGIYKYCSNWKANKDAQDKKNAERALNQAIKWIRKRRRKRLKRAITEVMVESNVQKEGGTSGE
jgi:lysyl-tRNA synthetase class I